MYNIYAVCDIRCLFCADPLTKGSSKDPGESIAAVVGTVDSSASQYVSYVRPQGSSRLETVHCLEEAMFRLLGSFRERNGGALPEHIIVYRDGVADNQFEEILEKELSNIQLAIVSHKAAMQREAGEAYVSIPVKIAFTVCQKMHHSRFVCESPNGPAKFTNLCPGVLIDSSSAINSVTSAKYNEFYLNAHVAIQGTGKAAKYSLLYDEIGLKMMELQLLTYWLTYMYCRCNRSVSVVTPVYYAHWAAKRARHQLSGGASLEEISQLSDEWAARPFSTMNFV